MSKSNIATVSATEANRSFSALLRRAKEGETIAITDRGKVVARIEPAKPATDPDKVDAETAARRRALLKEIAEEARARGYAHAGKFQREWAYED
jgi:prevent-host-death family protein